MRTPSLVTISIAVLAGAVAAACAEREEEGAGTAGAACGEALDCYTDVDPEEIQGEVMCLDRVAGGYCTHTCTRDTDCCAAQGECDGRPQVCAPFEDTGLMMCFLGCGDADIGEGDPDGYCHEYASPEFSCRSTGGGANNRKVCA